MAAEFKCEKCGKLLSLDATVGQTVTCTHCGSRIEVPATAQMTEGPAPAAAPSATPVAKPAKGDRAAAQPTQPTDEPEEDEEELEPAGGLLVSLSVVLPWAISVVFHAAVFLLLVFLVYQIRLVGDEDRIIIPDARLSKRPGGRINPGSDNPNLKTAQNVRRTRSHQYSKQEARDMMSEITGKTKSDLKIIGIGAGGGGGPLAAFGLHTGGSGAGPRSGFFGQGGNAYKICYVIDRSGSMLETFDYVREELKRSISNLSPEQSFHVIFFTTGKPQENPPRTLVPATPANKKQAFDYLDTVVPAGRTDPAEALKRAFEVRPELIYFMTDGEFDKNVVNKIREWNKDKKVKINAYAFLYETGGPLLRQIASENGGRYKFVSESDLYR